MIVSANIATYEPRIKNGSLEKTVHSLIGQVDEVRVYCNECAPKLMELEFYPHDNVKFIYNAKNIADNGKFFFLEDLKEPEIYLTCDDDLIYPPDYRKVMQENIEKFGCIISFHGRILNHIGVDYYTGHQAFGCLNEVKDDVLIDVCGTGVTGFDTRYFHPKGLANDPRLRMSDLIFSLEVAKQNKRMGVIHHKAGWIGHTDNKETIHNTELRKGTPVQNSIADEIFKLKYNL